MDVLLLRPSSAICFFVVVHEVDGHLQLGLVRLLWQNIGGVSNRTCVCEEARMQGLGMWHASCTHPLVACRTSELTFPVPLSRNVCMAAFARSDSMLLVLTLSLGPTSSPKMFSVLY